MVTKKNMTLELFKLFASYMVVFIHVKFVGEIDVIVNALARFAVPLFFLISGYYSYQISPKKIIKRTRNSLNLFIFATVCYIAFSVLFLLLEGNVGGVVEYFSRYLNIRALINFFVFNMPFSSPHLWYLLSIIYVYVVFYVVTVFRFNEKVVFSISFLLLFLHILLGECLSSFGIVLPVLLLRNFALLGIPFFALGLFVKKHENKFYKIPDYIPFFAFMIGVFESILSRYIFGKNELYIGSLFILFAVVTVFIKYSSVKYPLFFDSLSGCSTYIYIFHMMVSSLLLKLYELFCINFGASFVLKNMHPIIVCIASTVFSYCIIRIKNVFLSKEKAR